jgi:hypothetical protein
MLIWIANLPVDIVWYLPRTTRAWQGVAWAVSLLHFTVPFVLLLMRPIKRNSTAVAWIAGLILFMQLVFLDYQVLPGSFTGKLATCWIEFLVPVGIGGIWLAHFLWQMQRYPVLPLHDYNREAALHLRRLDEEEADREEALSYE